LAELGSANLTNTDLGEATLLRANLKSAKLYNANLSDTNLRYANFTEAELRGANFARASVGGTSFNSVDLSSVNGLDNVNHGFPSYVGVDTINKSKGEIPEVFLRGCGLSDWQIEAAKLHQPTLSNEEIINVLYRIHDLRSHQAIQINPLFISYSHMDNLFVDALEHYLNEKGIRFWRDVHQKIAGRLEVQVDRAIRLNPTVLLILSIHSVKSDWVQHEARLARKLEIETGHDVLCPIALDDGWKACDWPERLREQIMEYNILDFSGWDNKDIFWRMFVRLIEGLDLFYK
jgi:hypothetical protein